MKSEAVELEIRDGIAWLCLNRPAALNALNLQAIDDFGRHVRSLVNRDDVRVVVTRGAGRSFCAGSDIRELAGLSPKEAAAAELRHGEVFALLDELPQPTIAMLHGHVLGGGLGAALYHDFRIAAEDASIGLPEVALGWTPPWAAGRLVHAVGHSAAAWLLLANQRLSGTQAAARGLVNEAVPAEHLEARVSALADAIKAIPGEGVARTKRLLAAMSPYLDQRWDRDANKAFEACLSHPGARKSLADFERRSQRKT